MQLPLPPPLLPDAQHRRRRRRTRHALSRLRRGEATFLPPSPPRAAAAALLLLLLCLSVLLAGAAEARRQGGGYPAARDPYVNDYAQVLTPDQEKTLRAELTRTRSAQGIHTTVLTVRSYRDYGTGEPTLEQFATNLFNRWGIGDRNRDDGVLVLVAVRDRKMRVEVGSGYGDAYDAPMKRVIDDEFLPYFKRDAYGEGIVNGTRAVLRALPKTWPPSGAPGVEAPRESDAPGTVADDTDPSGTPVPVEVFTIGAEEGGASAPILPLLGGVTAVGGAWFGAYRYLRFRRRFCPTCRAEMKRLDEFADDAFLDAGQKREEGLGSVDYDIWQCASCGFHRRHGYSAWLSTYQRCVRCRYRTMSVAQRTITSPTQYSTGTAEVTKDCRHCGFHSQHRVTLPRLSSSSSSSSSSSGFGGGSSSGGGASGSW
jgi:Beta-propeller domains of methanol dehydrogenase type